MDSTNGHSEKNPQKKETKNRGHSIDISDKFVTLKHKSLKEEWNDKSNLYFSRISFEIGLVELWKEYYDRKNT